MKKQTKKQRVVSMTMELNPNDSVAYYEAKGKGRYMCREAVVKLLEKEDTDPMPTKIRVQLSKVKRPGFLEVVVVEDDYLATIVGVWYSTSDQIALLRKLGMGRRFYAKIEAVQ